MNYIVFNLYRFYLIYKYMYIMYLYNFIYIYVSIKNLYQYKKKYINISIHKYIHEFIYKRARKLKSKIFYINII